MKKLMSLMALAMIASVVAASAQQEVLSANAVGYVKVKVDPDAYLPIVYPFDILGSQVTEGVKFTETQIADELPLGSMVYFWSGEGWVSSPKNKALKRWTGLASTKVLADGEMFFVQPAPDATLTEYTLAGEVPAAPKTLRAIDSSDPEIYNAVGFAYPTEALFTNTTIAIDAPLGSTVYFWADGGWVSSPKNKALKRWTGLASTKVLSPGEGFFIKFAEPGITAWEQDKPYSWP